MGKAIKIILGIGILAGISAYGRRRMTTEELAARGGGVLGYLKGMADGLKFAFRFRSA